MNRTGALASREGTQAMTEAAHRFTPFPDIDTHSGKEDRIAYIEDADAIGSVPPPATVSGFVKTGISALTGRHPMVLMDKLGERIAYERAGTRLYEALITKYEALSRNGAAERKLLPAASTADTDASTAAAAGCSLPEAPLQTLRRIRAEELQHFHMLTATMQQLGGDPTAQTPCADVIAVASMGLMQVLTDPRTTLAQCMNAMVTAELTDNAGWELLAQLADSAGRDELVPRFLEALRQEEDHLRIVKNWLTVLVADRAGSEAV
jgi:hypothetical protein